MDKSTKWLIRIACLVIIGAPLGFFFQQKQAKQLEEVENFCTNLSFGQFDLKQACLNDPKIHGFHFKELERYKKKNVPYTPNK